MVLCLLFHKQDSLIFTGQSDLFSLLFSNTTHDSRPSYNLPEEIHIEIIINQQRNFKILETFTKVCLIRK